jgi:hypothetical protein
MIPVDRRSEELHQLQIAVDFGSRFRIRQVGRVVGAVIERPVKPCALLGSKELHHIVNVLPTAVQLNYQVKLPVLCVSKEVNDPVWFDLLLW